VSIWSGQVETSDAALTGIFLARSDQDNCKQKSPGQFITLTGTKLSPPVWQSGELPQPRNHQENCMFRIAALAGALLCRLLMPEMCRGRPSSLGNGKLIRIDVSQRSKKISANCGRATAG